MKKSVRYLMSLGLILMQLWSWAAQAISKEMQETVTYETKANAAGTRSDQKIMIENYEIPLDLLEKDVALRAPPEFVESLIFEKNGRKYVRWMINPEDTKWHLEVAKFLTENGVSTERHKYFEGYQTASRSYIVVDPKNGAEFSIKVSTDKTGGAWRDKKQTWEDASQIRMITDFVNERVKNQAKLQNIILLDEAMAFGIKSLDQGMIIRSYDSLSNSGKHYVPGFSIMHDQTGRSLALKNRALDPATFWNKHYNQALARAIAEFTALTGMTYDSPHSQNFMVELDAEYKPTGKIVMRDFGDTYLSKEYFAAAKRPDIPVKWEVDNVKEKYLPVSVGILHGNKSPSWMDMANDLNANRSYDQWGRDFYTAFANEFEKQSGVRVQMSGMRRSDAYMSKTMFFNTPTGMEFLNLVKDGKGRHNALMRSCSHVFAM